MIWVAGRSPTLVSQNLKATTLTYLAIILGRAKGLPVMARLTAPKEAHRPHCLAILQPTGHIHCVVGQNHIRSGPFHGR